MGRIWEFIKEHYVHIAGTYGVDPAIFIGIHVVVTPIFILSVSWLIRNYRSGKDTLLPAIVTIILYNIANVFIVICGKNIPLVHLWDHRSNNSRDRLFFLRKNND